MKTKVEEQCVSNKTNSCKYKTITILENNNNSNNKNYLSQLQFNGGR